MCMSIIFYPAALAVSSLINFPLYDRILSPTTMGYTGATLSPPSHSASRSRCLTLWTLSERWNCVESYDGRCIRKDLECPCPSRSWWIVEAVFWSVLVMSFVGFQLGFQSLCLWAMLQYPCLLPVAAVVHICCHSLRLAS